MRFAALAATMLIVALALVAGCGSADNSTPVACLEGAGAYERALASAPDEVLLEGETLISECLTRNQSGGDLSRVGEALLETATALNAEAREDPGGEASLQLGYLLGAVQRGSEEGEGIHADLLRRLVVAARFAPDKQPLPPEFVRAYRDGYAAGQSNG
ncbi:MAG TPA: hypothetical protein VNC16_00965 [Solirubrobacterales bacterium]|jgi:hypothetical protein|nr:hypothetical protein [Solirubrobacterales bacterium]